MAKMCEGCKYYIDNQCSENNKPYLCPIRTRGGVYKNINDSDIIYKSPFGNYKFKSNKQREKFEKMLDYRLKQLNAVEGIIFKYTDKTTKTFDLTNLVMLCYEKTYKESLISGNNIYKKAKR